MNLILVTGGARSGKSRFAESLAAQAAKANPKPGRFPVTYIACGVPTDEEMVRRIACHREDRPQGWETIECPSGVGDRLSRLSSPVVLLDCITTLVSNVILACEAEVDALRAAETELTALIDAVQAFDGMFIAVTNEVGSGLVPSTPLGRWFRDAQGFANQRLAEAATRVIMLVSGIPLELK